jgi:uncharacterized LabA/DUF88 family protein
MNNQAFIDAQNLYLGTTQAGAPWKIDLERFRVHLKQKYKVTEAYYFLGAFDSGQQDLYNFITECGYLLRFREHTPAMNGKKKGNVDTDIVFLIMKKLYKKEKFDKVILVSGDGDYKRMVSFLIEEQRFGKLITPSRKQMSSLYKRIDSSFIDALDARDKKSLLEYKKRAK